MTTQKIKVLALIEPIEKHVGHWACSSEKIEVSRILFEGDYEKEIIDRVNTFSPDYLAIVGKLPVERLDLIDHLSKKEPKFRQIPKIFRCQNTMLIRRLWKKVADINACKEISFWFRSAADPRWDVVIVQTLEDFEWIKKHFPDKKVIACHYAYDPEIFYNTIEVKKDIDVGCYMRINKNPERIKLLNEARRICEKHRVSFQYTTGIFWNGYADQVRRTKICLNWSVYNELTFRMYETAILGSVALTNPITLDIEQLFSYPNEYLVYKPDFSDLEKVLVETLKDKNKMAAISKAGQKRAENYSWPLVADKYIAPWL